MTIIYRETENTLIWKDNILGSVNPERLKVDNVFEFDYFMSDTLKPKVKLKDGRNANAAIKLE